MSDNIAVLDGFTEEYIAEKREGPLHLLIRPDADLNEYIRVWDMDEQNFINIPGWLYTFKKLHTDPFPTDGTQFVAVWHYKGRVWSGTFKVSGEALYGYNFDTDEYEKYCDKASLVHWLEYPSLTVIV